MREEVGGKRRLVDAQNDPICVRADVKTARTPPRQNDGSGERQVPHNVRPSIVLRVSPYAGPVGTSARGEASSWGDDRVDE